MTLHTRRSPLATAVPVLSAAALVLLLAVPAGAQRPVRIAGSLGLTGAYAELGQTQHRGYQLCVRQANERGGVLGRTIEMSIEDDESQPAKAVAIYQRLLSRQKPDVLLSPYSSPITDAVAEITERHRAPMVAAGAATTSIFRKGRRFLFMLLSPAEVYLEGLVDLAARRGLRRLAILHEETLFPAAIAQGTVELARKHGLEPVLVEAYPRGKQDFAALLAKVKAVNPDVLAAATYFDDAVAVSRQLRGAGVSPKMFAVTVGGDLPKFHEILGRGAEYVYGATQWAPELVALRAGGLIPIARQYPGAREFVESYRKVFPGVDLSYQTAQAYGACQLLIEAIRRVESLDGDKVRDALARLDTHTVFGAFKVDAEGFQIAHKMLLFQWQDGRKIIVWPEELAPGTLRFPTPPWSQR